MIYSQSEKLKELRENTPTIFAPNCWGGLTYHHLGLEFCSPLINMWETHDDYLKFLSDPKHYIDQDLNFIGMYDGPFSDPYPIVMLDDILIRMNHYKDFVEAAVSWARRKNRIKWDNLIVMFFDEDPEKLRTFMSLPYERKICFAPYDTGIDGVIRVPYRDYDHIKNKEFWEIMNNLAQNKYIYYDDVSLIFDGELVQIGNFEFDPDYEKSCHKS